MSPAAIRQLQIAIAGQRASAIGQSRDRLRLVMFFAMVASAVLTGRLIELTLIDPAPRKIEPVAEPQGKRAAIVDRNGVILAQSLKVYSLAARPRRIGDAEQLSRRIAAILPNSDSNAILHELMRRDAKDKSRRASFVWLRRKISPEQATALNNLGEPGLIISEEYERVYPNATLAAHILGGSNVDGKGVAGIESWMEKHAASADGRVTLTIDARVQHALEDEIARGVVKYSAIGGFGIVMDARNGDVIAMTSSPTFDPNGAADPHDGARFNHVTKGVYELGSIFKSFTLADALELGTTTPGKRYDATKPLRVAGYSIDDFHPERRWMTATDVFIHSSNIGTARMIDEIGIDQQRRFLAALGMERAPAIELPEVGSPLLPKPWGRLASMTVAYGHGISVTPLQMASGMSALVNGGFRVDPHLVQDDSRIIRSERIMSKKTSDMMRAMFRLAVLQGTGGFADVEGYRVGGKTGTALKPTGHGYSSTARISTFAAAFPMDAPRYVVLISLDEPKGVRETGGYATAGMVAAPLVRNFILRAAPALGVAKSDQDVDVSALMPYVARPKTRKSAT